MPLQWAIERRLFITVLPFTVLLLRGWQNLFFFFSHFDFHSVMNVLCIQLLYIGKSCTLKIFLPVGQLLRLNKRQMFFLLGMIYVGHQLKNNQTQTQTMYVFSNWFVWFALFGLLALFTKKKHTLIFQTSRNPEWMIISHNWLVAGDL